MCVLQQTTHKESCKILFRVNFVNGVNEIFYVRPALQCWYMFCTSKAGFLPSNVCHCALACLLRRDNPMHPLKWNKFTQVFIRRSKVCFLSPLFFFCIFLNKIYCSINFPQQQTRRVNVSLFRRRHNRYNNIYRKIERCHAETLIQSTFLTVEARAFVT